MIGRRKRFPFFRQMDLMDCGPTCLRMVARSHGRSVSAETLRDKCAITREGVSLGGIADAAEAIGLNSLAVQVDFDTLRFEVPLPCIAHWRQRHFVVVHAVRDNEVDVADPSFGLITYSRDEFVRGSTGGFRRTTKVCCCCLSPRRLFTMPTAASSPSAVA
jgi:ATP-binding cassette, subfamily B, bacterial